MISSEDIRIQRINYEKLKIRLLLWLTGIFLLLSVIIGSSRRRSKSISLKACSWVSYTMSSYLVGYALGLMQNSSYGIHNSFFPIWGLLLMLTFGSADSFSGYSLDDNEQWRRHNGQLLLKFGTLMLLLSSHRDVLLSPFKRTTLALLFLAAALKAFTKTQSLAAIRRFSLQKRNSLIMQHYTSSEASTGEMEQQESLEVMEQVTLEDVRTCKGDLFSHGGNADRLKDICMSFSFFKLLCLRYSGHTSSREALRTTWPLIQELLLSGENRHERVFRVLEEELAFLYDLLYTKHAVIFQPKRLYLRLVEFLLIGIAFSWLFFKFIISYKRFGGLYHFYSILDHFSPIVALLIYLVAETAQVILLAFTRWAKVKCVCRYVKHGRSLKKSYLTEKCIEFICRLPSRKPWERKLHQYSLLESFTYRPCKLLANPFMYQFIDWRRDGQKEGAPVALSRKVKEAVVDLLKDLAGSQLENGERSMRRHNVSSLLSYACKCTTQTQVIMVWHIATTICENKAGSPDSRVTSFYLATSLSKYLAYLVAFEPRLLPDHPAITESLFTETIKQARCQLPGCDTVEERIDKLYQTADRNGDTALCRGTKLAAQLLEEISDRNLMWEILADFWVEMMLFVAPWDDVRAHFENLANGGELLTHVWALLYHAGIERRSLGEQ